MSLIRNLLLSCGLLITLWLAGMSGTHAQPAAGNSEGVAASNAARAAKALELVWTQAAKTIAPSVVQLEVERSADGEPTPAPAEMFRDPRENPAYRKRPTGPVSGVILSADGYIVTSSFNLSGTITKLTVTLEDGRQFAGRVLARHEPHDLGLVKVEATDLPVPTLRDEAQKLRVGEFIAVVGRGTSPNSHTLSTGIISGLERQAMGALQFDAQTNYGNTGGALIDIRGRLIGIANTIKPNVQHGINSGVCFGMPMAVVQADIPDLKRGVTVLKPKVAFLGIKSDSDAVGVDGVRIAEVIPSTGAAAAGLQPGDVLTQFDGERLTTVTDMRKILRDKKVGDRIVVTYVRAGRERTTTVTLGARPD